MLYHIRSKALGSFLGGVGGLFEGDMAASPPNTVTTLHAPADSVWVVVTKQGTLLDQEGRRD